MISTPCLDIVQQLVLQRNLSAHRLYSDYLTEASFGGDIKKCEQVGCMCMFIFYFLHTDVAISYLGSVLMCYCYTVDMCAPELSWGALVPVHH